MRWDSLYASYRNRVTLISTGRKNVNFATPLRDDKAMVSGLAGANNWYLVISLYNTCAETSGTPRYAAVKSNNDARAEAFGQNYYDLQGWMIRHGLAAAGIAPTPQDLIDITNDVMPTSLRQDSTS